MGKDESGCAAPRSPIGRVALGGPGTTKQQGMVNMFRICLVFLVAVAMVQPASASTADAMFQELSKDFGSTSRGPTSAPLLYKNTTNAPITVYHLRQGA